jgi:type IV pilus assembly protein PilN
MAHINLLPWRAERRKQREREFFLQLGAAFVAALLFLFVWASWMGMRIDNQNERNAYLTNEIAQLDVRIAKIKDLEKVRQRLLARKEIIEQLQANRSQMVHLFDELVKTIPSNARLTGLKQSGDSMTLDGVAQSNASVAEYMRNIETSPWMGHADLRKTENSHDASRMPYTFGLDVQLSRPKTDDAAAEGALMPKPASGGAPTTAPTAPGPSAAAQALTGAAKAVPATVPSGAPTAATGKPAAAATSQGGVRP